MGAQIASRNVAIHRIENSRWLSGLNGGIAGGSRRMFLESDLFALKDAFGPRWETRHLAFPGDRSLPRVALALADVHTTRGLRQLLRR